jgi:hypothetical protein
MPTVDDASDANDKESIIILKQCHTCRDVANSEYVFAQDVPSSTINSDLVLLDSQSAEDLFTNPAHVQNIHLTMKPIQVHCNSGTMATTKDANFGDTPVYFNSRGIANVLSLYRLGRKFRVTYNSTDCDGVFQVCTKQGIVKFEPTTKGLHGLNLRGNPEAAFLLVDRCRNLSTTNCMSALSTIFLMASPASRLRGPRWHPTLWEWWQPHLRMIVEGMVCLNMLKDCPVRNDDINNAHTLFGTDLA